MPTSGFEISSELLDSLQKLSLLLDSENPLGDTLNTIAELSVATLSGCDSAGVSLRREGRDVTAAATDDFALEIDKIQYDTDQGPCVAAMNDGEIKYIRSIAGEERWPEFTRPAADRGLKGTLSIPLTIDGTVGALNIYAKTEDAFDQISVEVAKIFAGQAAIALKNAETYLAARRLAEQLNEALKTRDLIGQAKGILMEREGISDADAFAMLTRISQSANVKLRVVAQRLVEETLGSQTSAG